MVSDFFCESHDPMNSSEAQCSIYPEKPSEKFQFIKPSKNSDGYSTIADIVQQLEVRAIQLFKIFFPTVLGSFFETIRKITIHWLQII